MKIYIDGDACPVKEETYQLAREYHLEVIVVSSFAHFTDKEIPAHVTYLYVDQGSDSADFKLVSLVKEGDLLITQDYGLASLVLGKKVTVYHHLGFPYTQKNIEQLLLTRHLNQMKRAQGEKTKGPTKLTTTDRQHFYEALKKELERRDFQ